MANYNITKFTFTEKLGSAYWNNSLKTTFGDLIITPNPGYVVSASDFKVSTLPDGISRVTFQDIKSPGKPGNTVIVIAEIASTFEVTGNKTIKLDITGDAKFYRPEEEIVVTNVKIVDDRNINKYATSLVTANDGYTVDTVTAFGNNSDRDIITSTINSSSIINKAVKVASLTVTADNGYFIKGRPYLEDNSFSKGVIRIKNPKITRDNNNFITKYTFDVIVRSNNNKLLSLNASSFLLYKTGVIPTVRKEITSVTFGGPQISIQGGQREIKVYGNCGAEFDLTVTKASDGLSIIKKANSTVLTPSGVVGSMRRTLYDTKRLNDITSYTCLQTFPRPIVNNTTVVSGASSGGTQIKFTSLNNVAVGDEIVAPEIAGGRTVKVTVLNPDTDDVNECSLSESITIADGQPVYFIRKETYNINVYPREDTVLGPNIPKLEPHFTITQHTNPILKLTATETDSGYVGPGEIIYIGKVNANPYNFASTHKATAGARSSVVHYHSYLFRATYTLTATSGTFRDIKTPVWSKTDSTVSDWSNSVPANNGGTEIDIYSISVSGHSTTTYSIVFDVLIHKWGTDDVTMNINLDNIVETA